MRKMVMAGAAIAIALALYWSLQTPDKETSGEGQGASEASQSSDSSRPRSRAATSSSAGIERLSQTSASSEDSDATMLAVESAQFIDQVNTVIPRQLMVALVDCDPGGLEPFAKITITYTLDIRDGRVSTRDARVTAGDLGDERAEDCMVERVRQTSWLTHNLPDWSEEQQLFVRIKALKKYKTLGLTEESD